MLGTLFYQETVAVIGASRTPGKVGHDIVKNLVEGNFAGNILPINLSAESVYGLPCLKSPLDYEGKIDLAEGNLRNALRQDTLPAEMKAESKELLAKIKMLKK